MLVCNYWDCRHGLQSDEKGVSTNMEALSQSLMLAFSPQRPQVVTSNLEWKALNHIPNVRWKRI